MIDPKRLASGRYVAQRSLRARTRARHKARISLRCELLEPRWMLSADLAGSDGDRTPAMTWFDSVPQVERIPPSSLHRVDRFLPEGVAGPQQRSTGEWIVQLTDEAIEQIVRITDVNDLIRDPSLRLQFSLITGLGSEGLVLVRGQGESQGWIEASLASNVSVASFSLNQLIRGEDVNPGDIDYQLGRLDNLDQIGAPAVWHETIGSMRTVVGVLDTGIDYTHPDIFLNLWFNQGEIPSRFYDDQGDLLLTDIDGDGLITFYDLNNVTRSATEPYALHFGGWQNGPNATYVRDLNGNGYIDAHDILNDPLWADGRDTDGNGEADDFFGVNFMSDGVRNAPFDTLGHGTHVAGTIGAVGGNMDQFVDIDWGGGVVGINWQTSLMPLRILDSTNQGDTSAAIRAVNYATTMRDRYRVDSEQRVQQGANVRVLNNSWGQPGGYEAALEQAIANADDAGILFVAAAGNGNFLGQSVDNDRTPFYPASYDVPNVIAVAAGMSNGSLAPFSNYGHRSVDLVAPGIGIRSTESGGGFGSRNGTSMATPHVSGTAALIWSALPAATVEEVREAILSSVVPDPRLAGIVATGGRLSAVSALTANVFAPSARLVASETITESGGTMTEFTVEYFHRDGIDVSTLGDDDLVVTRRWGLPDQYGVTLLDVQLTDDPRNALATYSMLAPGTNFSGPNATFGPALVPVSSRFESTEVVEITPDVPVTITSDLVVADGPVSIDSFTLFLEIDHTYVQELVATLIAPDGSRVLLFNQVGDWNDNFHGTILDDSADTPIWAGSAPFTGRFRPEQPLSSLGVTNPNGVWTLEIQDVALGDGGALRGWGLDFLASVEKEQGVAQVEVQGVVSGSGSYSLSLDIHNWDLGGATATLVSPQGDRATLFENLAIPADFGGRVTFDDAALTELGSELTRGTFRPIDELASIRPDDANGTWTIEVIGDGAAAPYPVLVASLDGFHAWDVEDYGPYQISTRPGGVASSEGQPIQTLNVGTFDVRIEEPGVIYVDTFEDGIGIGSLRDAILEANATGTHTTIILNAGTYSIEIPPEIDPDSSFPVVADLDRITSPEESWSNGTTGDFTIESAATIIGSINHNTVIDGNDLDRVFRVFPDATLTLKNLTVRGGKSNGIGGGILSLGDVRAKAMIVAQNQATLGGAVAAISGNTTVSQSRITENTSLHDNVYIDGEATLDFEGSTMDNNLGGGIRSASRGNVSVVTSTFSANIGGFGAVVLGSIATPGSSSSPSISGDGRFIAFASSDRNFVQIDQNNVSDIFVYDYGTGQVERISVNNNGVEGNGASYFPSISSDGRFVAFESYASNLVPYDTNESSDIFVYDRDTGQVERISVSNDGVEGFDNSHSPSISADGRFVAFMSYATNLVPGDTNHSTDIFIYDRLEKQTKRVSVSGGGIEANDSSRSPSISADGRFVAFASDASNLVPNDTNESSDIFVYDRQEEQIERVSIAIDEAEANDSSFAPSISADGRLVAFESWASNLVLGDNNGSTDIFVFNRETRETQRVSVSDTEEEGNAPSEAPAISADGRYVHFHSVASNLVSDAGSFRFRSYVYDRHEGRIEYISEGPRFRAGYSGAISSDGRFVALGVLRSTTADIALYDREPQALVHHISPWGPFSVRSSTLANSSESSRTIKGDVAVSNSLFAGNDVERETDFDLQSNSFNLRLPMGDLAFLGPLSSRSHLPPVHSVLFGNPAANQGAPTLAGTLDQHGYVRSKPSIGAVDPNVGSLQGRAYVDFNRNGIRDDEEPWIGGVQIDVTNNQGTRYQVVSDSDLGSFFVEGLIPATYNLRGQATEQWTATGRRIYRIVGNYEGAYGVWGSLHPSVNADGRFIAFDSDASTLVPEDNNGVRDVFVSDERTLKIDRVSVNDDGEEGTSPGGELYSFGPSISADGRFVAFASGATNLVPDDNNNAQDIFVYDRGMRRIERIVSNGWSEAPSISDDGRFVAFASGASASIFLYDRREGRIERVSVNAAGETANGGSASPSISADGRFVAFTSSASNLVPGTNNDADDVFVYDRQVGEIERISVSEVGEEPNGGSYAPSISANGRFVAFRSSASNLVADDTNEASDIFVYDRWERLMDRVSVSDVGEEANGGSYAPSISANGRFVAFRSSASNLVADDNNNADDVFVYDRQDRRVARISVSENGVEGNGSSYDPSISADGRVVAFGSVASNLVDNDINNLSDVFVTRNPFLPPIQVFNLLAGEGVDNIEVGFYPVPGEVSGRLFEDTGVSNGVYDFGEPVLAGRTVFLDANLNGILDDGELSTVTDDEGIFRFEDVPSYRDYLLVVTPPQGMEQVTPENTGDPGFPFFLPAGGSLRGIDFGFRPIQTTGQSSSSMITGRVLMDTNGNGVIDEDDTPLAGRVVYLDGGTLGVLDHNDPREETDEQGYFRFERLPATVTPIRVILNAEVEQVFPLGSEFTLETFPLQDVEKREGNPQAVITAHFNPDDDDFLDVAVVLAHTNTLSIRLNDGSGGFLPEKFDFDLKLIAGDVLFSGPIAIVAGHFDDDPRIDVAITGNLSSNVMVLRNLDPATGEFADHQVIGVGAEPLGIVAGPFTGGPDTDLVVLTKSASSLYVLTNNGSGLFSAGPAIPTGGTLPASLVASDFSGDGNLDVAVTHAIFSTNDYTGGRVTLLTGNGAGGFTLHPTSYAVEASAAGSAVGDFNGDGLPDLAVANFGSNSISVLINQGDGTFQVQSQTLGTVQGALDIAVADIDNDGDNDILVSKLQTRQIAIFRNNGVDPVSGEVLFEPQENVGLGQFQFAERMPFALANLDNDTSGPGGSGTIDIVAVPQNTDTLYVLRNTLVQGSRRASVSGSPSDVSAGIDFLIRPAVLPPRFDEIGDPPAILEDASAQTVTVSGIKKGREAGPALQFWVTSSHPGLIPSPGLIPYAGGTTTSFSYAPLPDANGTAVLTVRAIDAGYDGMFGTDADASFERSFTVTVLPVNDPPTFSRPRARSILQTAGPQNIPGYVTNIGPGGGADEASQTLSEFTVDVDATFFLQPPAINAFGRLTFTPHPGRSGFVEGSISLSDNGGRANGGIDTTTRFFVLNILMVNQPPTFEIGGDLTVNAGAGPQQHPGFARDFHPGGGEDEEEQTISDFVVATDRPDLFASVPDISNDGTLIYTPLSSNSGTALVTVRVRDDGGRSNGGNDLSEPRTFQIRIEPATSPTVGWMQIGSGSPQRSMVSGLSVEFDQVVDVTAGAFEVERIESETIVPVALTVTAGQVADRTRVQLHFDGPHVNGGSLIDGNYRLRILGAKIIAGGNPLDGGGGPGSDYVDQFFRLYGDANGDGTVDLFDFAQFRSLFGKSVDQDPLVATLDVDGNGSINLLDFAAFRSNFGKSRL